MLLFFTFVPFRVLKSKTFVYVLGFLRVASLIWIR